MDSTTSVSASEALPTRRRTGTRAGRESRRAAPRTLLHGEPPRTYVAIQALRGAAAVAVVLEHAMFYAHERLDAEIPVWDFGRIGVFLFFAISGFVMVATNPPGVRRRSGSWRAFAVRRLIRVAPMYWIATTLKLLALVAVPAAVLHATLRPDSVIASYLFLPSRNVDGKIEPLLGVGWTLVFEMAFYALFTAMLLLRLDPTRWIGGIVAVLAIGYALRPAVYPPWAFYFDPIALFFAVGMVVAAWLQHRRTVETLGWLAGISAVWFATYALHHPGSADPDLSRPIVDVATMVGFCLLVLLEPTLSRWSPAWLRWLGDLSYSLYLSHPLIAPLAPAVIATLGGLTLGLPLWTIGIASVLGSLAVAVPFGYAMYRLAERPITGRLMRSAILAKR